MSIKHPHLGRMTLMPTAPGTCPECGRIHEPDQPHDALSLAYQYDFYGKNGRWPTWTDAMAHCAEDVRRLWTEALLERGQEVGSAPPFAAQKKGKTRAKDRQP